MAEIPKHFSLIWHLKLWVTPDKCFNLHICFMRKKIWSDFILQYERVIAIVHYSLTMQGGTFLTRTRSDLLSKLNLATPWATIFALLLILDIFIPGISLETFSASFFRSTKLDLSTHSFPNIEAIKEQSVSKMMVCQEWFQYTCQRVSLVAPLPRRYGKHQYNPKRRW